MPSMFSRRRGSSATRRPPVDQSTSNSATMAASQAFLQRPPSSSGTLSSAAAAAALRSHTTSPEPVGSIQTKRMIRRGSNSSIGSGSIIASRGGMNGRGELQRRDSQGSMTERTFRSPSPGGRLNGAASPDPNAPPLPAIPRNVSSSHNRSSSLDPPARIASPNQSGRAMSLDRNTKPPRQTARPATGKRLSNVNEEVELPDNSKNVNFSRPMSPPPSSPTNAARANSLTHGTGNWFSEPNVAASRSQQPSDADALEQKIARIQAAAGQPARRDISAGSTQGTHFARSHQQTRTPNVEMESYSVYDPSSRTFITKLRPKQVAEPPSPILSRAPAPAPGTYDPNTRSIVPAKETRSPAQITSQERVERPILNTDIHPPPRNPARLSPVSTSAEFVDTGRIISTSAGPAKAYVVPNVPKQRSNSLDVPHGSFDYAFRSREGSTSPSPQRSARFSASPVIPVTLHNPPARDVSPAKPALKHHSPSSSIRTSSPMTIMSSIPKSPVSETSDTASQASQDGFTGRKKKSVRVSFDEQAHAVEPIAVDNEDNYDELMKPRPALPSFGSIRRQRTPGVAETGHAETNDASNDHAIAGILRDANVGRASDDPEPPEVTSKDSAGNVSDDNEDATSPPTARTSANHASTETTSKASAVSDNTKIRDFATDPEPVDANSLEVPAINLLPPTPGVEDEERMLGSDNSRGAGARTSAEIKLPGGWSKDEDAQLKGQEQNPMDLPDEEPIIYSSPASQSPGLEAINEDTDTDEFSDAAEDLSELENGGYASLNAIAVSPISKPAAQEQPVAATTSPPQSPSQPQPSEKVDVATEIAETGSGDWSQATTYWSQLSKQQRAQIEREHLSSDDEARPPPASLRKAKKKSANQLQNSAAVANPIHSTQPPIQHAKTAQPAQPAQAVQLAKSTMRKSMRAQPDPVPVDSGVHMRQSMRSGGGTKLSSTLRNGPPSRPQSVSERKPGFAQKTMRPASVGGLSGSAAATVGGSNRAPFAANSQDSTYPRIEPKPRPQPAPVMTAKLQKELSHDSDSESSFKKKRRSSKTVDSRGRYSMKRSMRSDASQERASVREERPVSPTPPRGKGRDSFSIRSLSPTGSLFGRKKRVEEVRQSIRGQSVDSAPASRMTLRNGPSAKPPKPARGSQPTTKFKSRFADSDDDSDDDRPRGGLFRSRFADSDDDDENTFVAADLTPVRGIPRRQGQNDGDSTDLSDEDYDTARRPNGQRERMTKPLVPNSADIDKAMDIARQRLGIPEPSHNANEGATLQNGSLRNAQPEQSPIYDGVEVTPEKKKRGFMGSILRRNRDSTASIPQVGSPLRTQQEPPSSPVVTKAPVDMDQSPTASTRPQSPRSPSNKLIRRASAQAQPPRIKRGDSNYSNATAPPAVGDMDNSGDWPLPAVPRIPDEYSGRPNTSDGSPIKRGKASSVRFEDGIPDGVYSQRTGKKKKFSMLRRAFRLHD